MNINTIQSPSMREDATLKEQVRALSEYVVGLQKQLQYVLRNLDEDNLGEALSKTVNDVKAAAGEIERKVSDQEYMSFVKQTAQSLEARVQKNAIIASLNLSPEEIKILADKIALEGAVTVNGYFKINTDGSMEATGGKVGGFTLGQSALYVGYNTADISPTLYLGISDIEKAVAVAGSGDRKDWRLKIGANFGVTADGTPYMSGGKVTGTEIDTAGIVGYTQMNADLSELKQQIQNTMHLNAVTLNQLTVGTTALALRQVTIDGATMYVLATQ